MASIITHGSSLTSIGPISSVLLCQLRHHGTIFGQYAVPPGVILHVAQQSGICVAANTEQQFWTFPFVSFLFGVRGTGYFHNAFPQSWLSGYA